MIDLYYWTTPNGHKITIFLEEAGLPYTIHAVNIGKGEQFTPAFLKISPNNRIPGIVDQAPADGGAPLAMFESGAILVYLADKTGRFIPAEWRARLDCIQWVFWQMGNLGPMAGQNHHFGLYAPEFIVGDYSIADIASYPWVVPERQQQNLDDFPHLKRWKETIKARPAVIRAYELAKKINVKPVAADEEAKKILFGQSKDVVR